jgi:pimeloyl-ACP methyl ester carboxylesterase
LAILHLGSATDIHYERIDGPQGRPWLIFLHEGLGCTAMWKDFPRRLCAQAGCPGLVYDREGYGLSSALTKTRSIHYLHEYALRELPEVLSALIPGEPYFLIGHSDGGSIALLHAAEQPALLRGIVTEAAHVFVESVTLDGIHVAVEAFKEGKLNGLARYHGDKTAQLFSAWADTWLRPEFRAWNIEYLLPSIACPALILQGADDQYGSAAQVDAIVAKAMRAQGIMVEDCGHTPHQEKPAALLQLMHDFLSRQTGG